MFYFDLFGARGHSDVEIDIEKREFRIRVVDVMSLVEAMDLRVCTLHVENSMVFAFADVMHARECECGVKYLTLDDKSERNPYKHPDNGCPIHVVESVLEL